MKLISLTMLITLDNAYINYLRFSGHFAFSCASSDRWGLYVHTVAIKAASRSKLMSVFKIETGEPNFQGSF